MINEQWTMSNDQWAMINWDVYYKEVKLTVFEIGAVKLIV